METTKGKAMEALKETVEDFFVMLTGEGHFVAFVKDTDGQYYIGDRNVSREFFEATQETIIKNGGAHCQKLGGE